MCKNFFIKETEVHGGMLFSACFLWESRLFVLLTGIIQRSIVKEIKSETKYEKA